IITIDRTGHEKNVFYEPHLEPVRPARRPAFEGAIAPFFARRRTHRGIPEITGSALLPVRARDARATSCRADAPDAEALRLLLRLQGRSAGRSDTWRANLFCIVPRPAPPPLYRREGRPAAFDPPSRAVIYCRIFVIECRKRTPIHTPKTAISTPA